MARRACSTVRRPPPATGSVASAATTTSTSTELPTPGRTQRRARRRYRGCVDVEACSLKGDDLRVRLANLHTLLVRASSRERRDEVAAFRFRRDEEEELRRLIEQESECCGFWRFDVRSDGVEVVLRVGVVAPQFAHFVDRFYELADT
jgi:hypothetical protein